MVAPIAGKLTVRVKSRYLMGLGLLLVALGCELMTHVQPNSTWTVLLPGFIVAGIGVGITNPVLASATSRWSHPSAAAWPPGRRAPSARSGIATGIAGLGAVFLSQIRPNTSAALAQSPAGRAGAGQWRFAPVPGHRRHGVREAAAAIPVPAVRNALIGAYQVGYAETFNHLMVIATVIAAIGAVGSLVLVRQRDFVPSSPRGSRPARRGGRGAARQLAGRAQEVAGADRAGGRAGSRFRLAARARCGGERRDPQTPSPGDATDEALSPMKR